ncbi:D-glutamate cyclase family protein [Rhodococcoides kyotonense]|uniref:Uncharacterized protein YcsI, UPF0317 family n=1 Tax=Rhodococcoides kyotonense TaxID=398843 RepID=A0A239IQY7_9NOCA|nr:DUF1445 domain-containing protein [Rhodococcus kyotonensis]SNS95628.1 Uncharacterized protein YcsI, UPF0317 family [Rhodococcus kyotonensis]
MTPRVLRERIASGEWTTATAGLLDGHQQANLVVVPESAAAAFEEYCAAHPTVCPVLARTQPGDPTMVYQDCTVDISTMIPRYRVWESGTVVDEPNDLSAWWKDDSVAFALGCSHTFDGPLRRAGISVATTAPPVYITDRILRTDGAASMFDGPLAVSMRPVDKDLVDDAIAVTGRYPTGHGSPVHVGDPAELGIDDITRPDFGVFAGVGEGQVPVFWDCGVTPQLALGSAGLAYAATHYPGHMLVLDAVVS